GVDQYFLDGWKSISSSNPVTWVGGADNSGRILTIPSSKAIRQTIERADIPAGTYVLSIIGTSQGRIYKAGSSAPSYASGPITFVSDGTDDVGIEIGTGTIAGIALLPFPITAISDIPFYDDYNWCRRYFRRYTESNTDRVIATGFTPNTSLLSTLIALDPSMRTVPTAVFSAASTFR